MCQQKTPKCFEATTVAGVCAGLETVCDLSTKRGLVLVTDRGTCVRFREGEVINPRDLIVTTLEFHTRHQSQDDITYMWNHAPSEVAQTAEMQQG
jgi:hypothetical protein